MTDDELTAAVEPALHDLAASAGRPARAVALAIARAAGLVVPAAAEPLCQRWAAGYNVGHAGKARASDTLVVSQPHTGPLRDDRGTTYFSVVGKESADPTVTVRLGRAAARQLLARLALAFDLVVLDPHS